MNCWLGYLLIGWPFILILLVGSWVVFEEEGIWLMLKFWGAIIICAIFVTLLSISLDKGLHILQHCSGN